MSTSYKDYKFVDVFTRLNNFSKESNVSVTTHPQHEETEEQGASMLGYIGETSAVCPKESGQEFTLLKPVKDTGEKSEECPKYGEGSTLLRKRRAVHSVETSEESPKYGEGSTLRRAVRSGVKPTLCDRYHGEKSEVFPKSGQEFILLKTVEQGRLGHTGEKLEACPESGERSTLLKKQMVVDRPSCDRCGKTFSDRSGLNKHMLVHIGDKLYVCPQCGKRFIRNDILQQHLMAHTGAKNYLCHHCGKRFSRLGNLKEHMMGHNGTRPYPCSVCGKLFSRLDYLKNHMVVHGDKPYMCPHCGNRYTQLGNMNKHIQLHTTVLGV
nr:gastrula zinc finger protein XlCGF8.2DB-like [Procambarus clarkii]